MNSLNKLDDITPGQETRADFSGLVGRWVPDPDFDDIIESQRQIDPDLWK